MERAFDEPLAEEGMGDIYDEVESKVEEVVFEDYVSDVEGENGGEMEVE